MTKYLSLFLKLHYLYYLHLDNTASLKVTNGKTAADFELPYTVHETLLMAFNLVYSQKPFGKGKKVNRLKVHIQANINLLYFGLMTFYLVNSQKVFTHGKGKQLKSVS